MILRKVYLLVFSILLLSCKEDLEDCLCLPEMEIAEMSSCHESQSWDPAKVRNQLEGKWTWQYSQCLWNGMETEELSLQGRVVEFYSVDHLRVIEGNEVVADVKWTLEAVDNSFQLVLEENVSGLGGLLLFCDEQMSTNLSQVDGCDHMFFKEETDKMFAVK